MTDHDSPDRYYSVPTAQRHDADGGSDSDASSDDLTDLEAARTAPDQEFATMEDADQ